MPTRTAPDIERLVGAELEEIADLRVLTLIRSLLVTPPVWHERDWDYGEDDERYPCWTVAEHPFSGQAIVFSDDGFGPEFPWGLVPMKDTWFGMDCDWSRTLQQAFLKSCAWAEAQAGSASP